jgi:hypothetical protein
MLALRPPQVRWCGRGCCSTLVSRYNYPTSYLPTVVVHWTQSRLHQSESGSRSQKAVFRKGIVCGWCALEHRWLNREDTAIRLWYLRAFLRLGSISELEHELEHELVVAFFSLNLAIVDSSLSLSLSFFDSSSDSIPPGREKRYLLHTCMVAVFLVHFQPRFDRFERDPPSCLVSLRFPSILVWDCNVSLSKPNRDLLDDARRETRNDAWIKVEAFWQSRVGNLSWYIFVPLNVPHEKDLPFLPSVSELLFERSCSKRLHERLIRKEVFANRSALTRAKIKDS